MAPSAAPALLGRASRRADRALTLIELLVAMAVSLVFMGSVAAAYISMSKAADESSAAIRAHTRARIALDQVASDLHRLIREGSNDQLFLITPDEFPYGDRIDNDGDGSTDEEVLDGFDDDGDWTVAYDSHAVIGSCRERQDYVGAPDLGDWLVDEDCRFANDTLTFRMPADEFNPTGPFVQVTYRLGTFDGQDHVLLREESNIPPVAGDPEVSPVAFDVVSFDVMGWNPNNDAVSPWGDVGRLPYWASEWDSAFYQPGLQHPIDINGGDASGYPPFEIPAVVLVRIAVSAESQDLQYVGWWPGSDQGLKTTSLSTAVYMLDKYDLAVIPPSGTEELLYDWLLRPTRNCR